MAERGFSDELGRPVVVAHRGASAEEPENTLAAFEAAVGAGADAVEFDVRITADGHPVLMHDPDVDRSTDGRGLVRDLTLLEIKRLRVRSSSGEPAEVPTLVEALALLSGRAGIDVEIKNLPWERDHDPDREPLVHAVRKALDRSGFVGPVLVSSFDPGSIGSVRRLIPRVATGLLALPQMPVDDAIALASGAGHGWVLPSASVLEAAGADTVVAAARAAGLRVGTWIVDDPAVAVRFAEAEVDAIATNDPRSIATALR